MNFNPRLSGPFRYLSLEQAFALPSRRLMNTSSSCTSRTSSLPLSIFSGLWAKRDFRRWRKIGTPLQLKWHRRLSSRSWRQGVAARMRCFVVRPVFSLCITSMQKAHHLPMLVYITCDVNPGFATPSCCTNLDSNSSRGGIPLRNLQNSQG